MKVIHAVYENGVFRPTGPVDLPEHCRVEFEPKVLADAARPVDGLDRIYEILGERYDSGRADLSERHDERTDKEC
jgi:predicted DNA-binding antitoxin AbrB/MazE fold protein